MSSVWYLLLDVICGISASPPNIIFFMADQQRQDSIGAYPGSAAITPHLDSLAADGILFTNSWTSTPSCTPARAAILTGRSPWGHGMLGYGAVGQKYPYELIHPLNDAGYLTASIGKNHFGFLNGSEWSPVAHGYQHLLLYDGLGDGRPAYAQPENHDFGSEFQFAKTLDPETFNPSLKNLEGVNCSNDAFDDYDQYFQTILPGEDPQATGKPLMDWNSWRGAPFIYNASLHPTAWVAQRAISYLTDYAARNTSQPLFLKISFHRPHSPYDPPQKYIDFVKNNYNLSAITDIRRTDNGWDQRFTDTQWCGQAFMDAWCGEMAVNDTNMSRISYYANVRFIDAMVGEILATMKNLGLYDESYVLWTADHGDQLGEHNLWRKTYPYNGNAKVPMIVRWPKGQNAKMPRGSVDTAHVVELRDVMPTLQSAAGVAMPMNWSTPWSGRDMNCVIREGEACAWREWVDLEHSTCYNETNHWNALTDGVSGKYVFNAFFASEQLFDLSADPNEMVDLAPMAGSNATVAKVLAEWRQRMVEMFEAQGRGDAWVKDGVLQQRTQGQTYGPNFPQNAAPCQ